MILLSLSMAFADDGDFGSKRWASQGLVGTIYSLPEGTRSLPDDWSALEPEGTIYTDIINVPPRAWTEGFPGVTDRSEWFAIVYTGYFLDPDGGCYTLRLLSDDGSRLFIDEELVIDHNGLHAPSSRSEEACWGAGLHHIRLEYFQGPRVQVALQLFATSEGGEEELFPGERIQLMPPPPAGSGLLCGLSGCCCSLAGLLPLAGLLWRRLRRSARLKKGE